MLERRTLKWSVEVIHVERENTRRDRAWRVGDYGARLSFANERTVGFSYRLRPTMASSDCLMVASLHTLFSADCHISLHASRLFHLHLEPFLFCRIQSLSLSSFFLWFINLRIGYSGLYFLYQSILSYLTCYQTKILTCYQTHAVLLGMLLNGVAVLCKTAATRPRFSKGNKLVCGN